MFSTKVLNRRILLGLIAIARSILLGLIAIAGIVAIMDMVFVLLIKNGQNEKVPGKIEPGGMDMVTVLEANNRGIGLMERFQYEQAVQVFAEVVRLAPDWQPGQINLSIALLNTNKPDNLKRAVNLLEKILQQEPDNPYAHFCLGIILRMDPSATDQALRHFEKVTQRAPDDPHAWYFLGSIQPPGSKRARACFEKALQLDPFLSGAFYSLAMLLREEDPQKAETMLEQYQRLTEAGALNLLSIRYGEMGHYAEVIGKSALPEDSSPSRPLPLFSPEKQPSIRLAPEKRWATEEDFGLGDEGDLRKLVRRRFGGTLLVFDYDKDGRPDLLLLSAVIRQGKLDNVLLRNGGSGNWRDVTAEAGLAGLPAGLGGVVADFDNNSWPDLLLTGVQGIRLLRSVIQEKGPPRFEDVTVQAGLDSLHTVCLGAAFVDIDNDGDLDLVLAQSGATPQAGLTHLQKSGQADAGSGLALFVNIGEALPNPTDKFLPLQPKFRRADKAPGFPTQSLATVNLAVTDIDCDRDLDLVVLADGQAPMVIRNDRLLNFSQDSLPASGGAPAARKNGCLVFDFNRDQQSDLLVIGPEEKPVLLVAGKEKNDLQKRFHSGATNAPPLLQAQAIDVDLDGRTDVVGLSEERHPVFLHNDGQRLVHVPEAFGSRKEWPADLAAVTMTDIDGDGLPDLVAWSEKAGVLVRRNLGNGNQGLPLLLSGRNDQGTKLRCNADGFGTWVLAQAGDLGTGGEWTTLSAGLGQSRQPFLLGLGRFKQADVLRLRWPDGTLQAELSLPAGQPASITQTNRTTISCPMLFTWNGQRFEFIGDFLGAGSLGECLPGGGHRQPRPEEAVKIEAEQLVPKDGRFILKVAEPMDEVTYLDQLHLVVVDHPKAVRVYPDERFAAGGHPPTQDLLVFANQGLVFPRSATDQRGRDVAALLRDRDRRMVDNFGKRSWLGFAEDHEVILDFGDRLQAISPDSPLFLFLAGWTDYPYPESIWAADQAGVVMKPPRLERQDTQGRWQEIPGTASFPAGLPRMMTLDVTGRLTGPSCRLRLRSNLQVFWDQIFAAPLLERIPAQQLKPGAKVVGQDCRVHCLGVGQAHLQSSGCPQEFSPDGRQPTQFDYHRRDPVPVTRLEGKLTKFGEVTDLLQARDDRFAIFGPGDEATVMFDAVGLPPLPEGWVRSFVLRSWGYCKDCSLFTATGGSVEPLPFQGMSGFPYPANEIYPGNEKYLKKYQVRGH